MKLAMLPFGDESSIWTPGTIFINLKDWWIPPSYVEEFWAFGCKFRFSDDSDYTRKREEILISRRKSINDFWKLMVL